MRTPRQRLRDSITKDNLWIYILMLLSKRDIYPYQMKREIEKAFGFRTGNVTIYFVLHRIKRGGYVKFGKKIVEGGPERKYYKITKKGFRELTNGKEILKEWSKKVEKFMPSK